MKFCVLRVFFYQRRTHIPVGLHQSVAHIVHRRLALLPELLDESQVRPGGEGSDPRTEEVGPPNPRKNRLQHRVNDKDTIESGLDRFHSITFFCNSPFGTASDEVKLRRKTPKSHSNRFLHRSSWILYNSKTISCALI